MTTVSGLEVEDLTITFGGVVAVSSVSLNAAMGTVTGLIGPNGAGKTTTFAGCTGLVRPAKGRVRLLGSDITKASPAQRARKGLGRTFQRVEVCESMSVRSNVLVGAEARIAGANPLRHLGLSGRAGTARRVDDVLHRCAIDHLSDLPVRSLSTGQKRLVELARVLAADFRFLLLDEPSSGLDDKETERFAEILRQVVDELGVGILLVEHDMELVMGVCSRLHVLEFGHLIFSGSPAETRSSELVRAAYLGAESDATTGAG